MARFALVQSKRRLQAGIADLLVRQFYPILTYTAFPS